MKTRSVIALVFVWLLSIGASAPVRMTPFKVTEGIYMLEHSGGSGNSTVIFTNDGAVVLDFHIANADQTLAFIRKTTDKKVRYLITSHSAGDHASGAWHFREDAPVWIATKNQMHDLQMQEGKEFIERKNSKDPRYAAYQKGEQLTPTIAIDGPMTLYFGGLTFQITPEGRAHSTGSALRRTRYAASLSAAGGGPGAPYVHHRSTAGIPLLSQTLIAIAADLCIYTNHNRTIEVLE